MDNVFTWRNSKINYITFGEGNETLICFHGYGQNCQVFSVLEPSLSRKYKVVSVDLPHQGKTIWGEKNKLSPTLLGELMQQFLQHVNASPKISIMAYSIGGNYALGFASAFPEKINSLWLIAADGLKVKPMFNFVTKTTLGRALFQNFVLYPSWVFYSLKWAKRLRIASSKVVKFYYSTMDSKIKRQALLDRWSSTARISVKPSKAIEAINKHRIQVRLIFGLRDSVIPIKNAERFANKVDYAILKKVDSGHQLLKPETNEIIKELLSQ